ncbi:MAG: helix-turn-helix transcriptional regulator [Desulfobacteraceae bacterium]|nr:helix-turn-helix transcriptional regulator [Desulfobacteraceae bacterium]
MERNERLTTLRILNGLTQDLLSTKSGLPRGSISIWEKGNNAPSHDAVPKLSAALNVPSGYLMYGSPPLDAAVWQPMVPAPRHLPTLAKELANNMAGFCEENQITRFAWYQGDDGRVIFLGKADKPFSFLLLQKPELDGCMSKALETLEEHVIEGSDLTLPLQIGFLEEMDAEHLMRFVRLVQNSNLEVDGDGITTEFLKAKQNLGLTSDSESKSFATNAYIHMRTVLEELQKPAKWRPSTLNPRYPTLIENESAIFESLFEVCKQKSLIWTGELNEELADMVRKYLKAHGYKEKK